MHWTPFGRLLAVILATAAAACGSDVADDDATGVDAAAPLDDAGDGTAPSCVTAGDGSAFAQCCVWDAAGCDEGRACYWDYRPDHGANDGACFPPGDVIVGGVCQLQANSCVPGAFCLWDEDSPNTGTGTCRTLCNPAAPACGASEHCEVPFGDGSIGFCTGGA